MAPPSGRRFSVGDVRKLLPYHRQLHGGPTIVVRNSFLDQDLDEVRELPRTRSAPTTLLCGSLMDEVGEVDVRRWDEEMTVDSRSTSSSPEGESQQQRRRNTVDALYLDSTTAAAETAASDQHLLDDCCEFDMEMILEPPVSSLRAEAEVWTAAAPPAGIDPLLGLGQDSTWLLPEAAWAVSAPVKGTKQTSLLEDLLLDDGQASSDAGTCWAASPLLSFQASPHLSFQGSPALVGSPELLPQGAPAVPMSPQWMMWELPAEMSPRLSQFTSQHASPVLSPIPSPVLVCQASPLLEPMPFSLQEPEAQQQQQQQQQEQQQQQQQQEHELEQEQRKEQEQQQKQKQEQQQQQQQQQSQQQQQQQQQKQKQKQKQKQSLKQQQQPQSSQPQLQLSRDLLDTDGTLDEVFSSQAGPLQAHTIKHIVGVVSGVHRYVWTVDAGKLRNHERQAVSPSFDLPLGERVTSRLVIFPRPNADGKGSASFKKSNGWGSVQLKCEASGGMVTFMVSVSDGTSEFSRLPRGPVIHNFASHSTCSLPKEQEQWDFSRAVNKASQTFAVCLDILPHSLHT